VTKVYLGDGVYCDFDGLALVLTTENGVSVTNTIVLEPEVYTALARYVERLTEDAPHPSTCLCDACVCGGCGERKEACTCK
jgi:hypothetical protein